PRPALSPYTTLFRSLDKLARWDPDLLDARRLARSLVDDLLAGWGADPAHLAAAHAAIDRLARRRPLVERVDAAPSSLDPTEGALDRKSTRLNSSHVK